eukprot:jgi/Chlat1/2767/Chrsp187S02942
MAVWLLSLLLAALLAAGSLSGAVDDGDLPVLAPGRPLLSQRLYYFQHEGGGAVGLYRIEGVKWGAAYEARVCWPASIPTVFDLSVSSTHSENQQRLRYRHRRLLNAEKVVFKVDEHGRLQDEQGEYIYLLVRARREGVRPSGKPHAPYVEFNLQLDELILGSLPASTLPALALCVVCLAFAWLALRFALARGYDMGLGLGSELNDQERLRKTERVE